MKIFQCLLGNSFVAGVVRLLGHVHPDRAGAFPRNASGSSRPHHRGHDSGGWKEVRVNVVCRVIGSIANIPNFYPSIHILPRSFISAVKISGNLKIATNYDTALDFNDT